MSNEVEVAYGDNAAGVANQLLAAARKLEVSTKVVKTTSDNVFLVPQEVADEAGLSFNVVDDPDEAPEAVADGPGDADEPTTVPEGTLEARVAWVAAGEDESERTKRANEVHAHEAAADYLTSEEMEQLNADLTTAVHGSAPEDDTKDSDSDPGAASNSADEPLIGKALNEALEKAGLSKSGKVAEKQARLAEYQKKE